MIYNKIFCVIIGMNDKGDAKNKKTAQYSIGARKEFFHMKLQYAMDTFSMEEALDKVNCLLGVVDVFEIGTPMLLRYGLEAVRTLRAHYPQACLLADAKIMDGGELEADMCYQAGANITTVMGLANPGTLEGALRSARRCGGRLLADMLNVTDLTAQAAHLHDMGVDLICVHNATDVLDMQRTVAEAQRVAQAVPPECLVIAGGINPDTVAQLKRFNPGTLIVGHAITVAHNPREMALTLRRLYENA